jgi:hypothetical protein
MSPAAPRRPALAALLLAALAFSGCVEVNHLVKMNRDGSGTLTERVRILPRTVRLLAGRKARTGESETQFSLLSDQAVQKRAQVFGEVTVRAKKQETLPDGAVQIETVYDFKDVNKVTFWMSPTFACTDKGRTGALKLPYARIVWSDWNKKHQKMDRMGVEAPRPPNQARFSSPADVQRYRRVTPMFQDMLRDFKFEIQVRAPADLEQFEDHSMVNGMPFDGATVTVYRVYGENVVLNPDLVRGFLMGEVGGRIDAWGGDWRKAERALPNTFTPYGSDYGGMGMRFLKTIADASPDEVPAK